MAAFDEAVEIYRELMQARPDAFRRYLARALNNRSLRLADLGRREEALPAAEEAVRLKEIHRRAQSRLARGDQC